MQRFRRSAAGAGECSQVHSVANKYGLCPTRLDMASLCGVCMKKILKELKVAQEVRSDGDRQNEPEGDEQTVR